MAKNAIVCDTLDSAIQVNIKKPSMTSAFKDTGLYIYFLYSNCFQFILDFR